MIGHSADVIPAVELEALVDAILAKEPDVVFIDLMLGQLSGHDVVRGLRKKGSEAYLIAITGWGEPDDHRFSLEVGFDEHWTKPLDTSQVEVFMREKPQRKAALVSA